MGLSDIEAKAAKPRDRAYKIADGKGLFLLVQPSGAKYWRLRFEISRKSKTLPLGVYPEVSLKEARRKCAEAREDLRKGIDPCQKRKIEKLEKSLSHEENFEAVAREWHEKRIKPMTTRYSAQVMRLLEANVFPQIGTLPINEIAAPTVLGMLRRVEMRGALVTVHTIRSYCSQIFRFAIALGKARHDVAADLRGVLKVPNRRHFSHLEANELPEFLRKLESYDGDAQTKRALKLVMYTLVRTTDMRGAKKSEIDFEKATWLIPAERMKMREKHIVPLSKQALALFKEQFAAARDSEFVFPNRQRHSSFMSENTMLYAIYRMGYHGKTTTHGFRHTGSTILNEQGFNRDHVERQLAHADRDQVRATYNYAEYLSRRAVMMQWWADYLDGARSGK